MITTPTLLVDEDKCRRNIEMMASKASTNNLVFRPHFKTHQSHQIGSWYREAGVTKITCSSLAMAKYFAEDGWNDITVAFPVNVLEIETINKLSSSITLNVLIESEETISILNQSLNNHLNVFIKIDVGTRRTGVQPNEAEKISTLIEAVNQSEKMSFTGFLAHAGHSYSCRTQSEILAVHSDSMAQLAKLKNQFPSSIVSYGDTPTCSVADSFPSIDELRPGNFCFYDLMQVQIGSCVETQIAVAVACPVVAKHPERNEVVVYGGGVHFSKDRIEENGKPIFGKVLKDEGSTWSEIQEGVSLIKVSQEHGIIRAPSEWVGKVKIGDLIKILPVHSCMTMNSLKDFRLV